MSRKIVAEVLLFLFLAVAATAYEPLTMDQALAYMARDPEAAVLDIIELDLIEHTIPDVVYPQRRYAWKGRDLSVTYQPAWLDIAIGPLSYRAFLEPEVVADFKPASGWVRPALIGIGVGTVLGLLLGLLAK